mmetsp:Transcript_4001/g.8911  ORF Transcript_4001/g.8911 Transcript_4001/m.8911 type:complete len:721 (+) Transcript_4001:1569-3731(+)
MEVDYASEEEDGSGSEDDPFDEPPRLEYDHYALVQAMCAAKAAECHENFVLGALSGLRDGKELDISLLIKHVESIGSMRISTNRHFLDAAVDQTTSILGRERFEDEVKSVANEMLGRFCPGMATPEETMASVQRAFAAGSVPAADSVRETRSTGKIPNNSRRRRACKRPVESPPSTSSPPPKRMLPRKRMSSESPASSPQSEQKKAAAETKKSNSATSTSRPRPDNSTTAPRGQPPGLTAAQDRTADECGLDAATLSPAADVSAPAAAEASTVDVREETRLISTARFEGRVIVFSTSLWHLAGAKLASIFNSSDPKLDELPGLVETVFDCLGGGFNSVVCLRSSLAAEQSELEHIVGLNEGTQFKAVLRCMEKLNKRGDEGIFQECERLQQLRGAIYSHEHGGAEGQAPNGAVRDFLRNRVSARNRIAAFANLGVMHLILSSNTVSQILHGLKHEDECIGSLGLLARRLNPGVPFDIHASGWRALSDILMPSLLGQDEVVTLTFDAEGEDKREVSRHRLAAKVICMLIDSLVLVRARSALLVGRRKQYLYGENGLWAQADSATICQRGGAASTAEQGGSSGEGYFLQTETEDDGQGIAVFKPETGTHRDRRMRPMALLKALLLRGAIRAREPTWDFAGVDFMCNLLFLSPTDQMNCLRHVSKEYFCGEWTDKVQKAAKKKRELVDKKIANASSKYAEDVKQNVVIENEQQLNSLKHVYNY